MPLYEYKCGACGHAFEKIVKFSDPPLDACPKCGGAVQKLFSSPAIKFKGSGWYINDYAKKSSGDGASGSKDSAEKSDKSEKTEKSGESKGTDSTTSSTSSDTAKPAPTPSSKES